MRDSYVPTILVLAFSISNFAATRSVFVISADYWPLLPFLSMIVIHGGYGYSNPSTVATQHFSWAASNRYTN